jgi:membrane associated rhomboid family serine protease
MLDGRTSRGAPLPDDQAPDDRPEWLTRQTPEPDGAPAPHHTPRPERPPARGVPRPGRPVVTLALLAVNAVMLLVEAASSGGVRGLLEPTNQALCRLGALNAAAIAESGQYWRLFTVMVLHAGVIHFALNSYALYIFGPQLEYLLGRARYLAVYVGAGFVGAAASFAFGRPVLGVGASGAIFGLLGAMVAFFFRRRRALGSAPLQNVLFIVAINLFLATRIANIDNTAHIGGFVGGLLGMALFDAVPADRGRLRDLALVAPFLVGIALTAYGVATFPAGTGQLTCAGV